MLPPESRAAPSDPDRARRARRGAAALKRALSKRCRARVKLRAPCTGQRRRGGRAWLAGSSLRSTSSAAAFFGRMPRRQCISPAKAARPRRPATRPLAAVPLRRRRARGAPTCSSSRAGPSRPRAKSAYGPVRRLKATPWPCHSKPRCRRGPSTTLKQRSSTRAATLGDSRALQFARRRRACPGPCSRRRRSPPPGLKRSRSRAAEAPRRRRRESCLLG
mmetsp:Transcript_22334/g.79676  ORF Transcript_22334/g.79676 Transcript_22334/m.79676 type:complete len:219 (+) Transcript_22334:449-1105(+)